MKVLKPLVVTASFKIVIDMNELLEDFIVNTNIDKIKMNVGMFLREKISNESQEPGGEFVVPGLDEILANLQEWDFVSSKE